MACGGGGGSLMNLNILLVSINSKNVVQEHHDSNEASQVKFFNDVLQLEKAFEEFGNLFFNSSFDLVSFGTNTLDSKEQIRYPYDIREAGKQQFKKYWNKAVVNNTSAISNTIKNNKCEIFSTSKSKTPSKLHQNLKVVKNDVGLFSRLFIDSQTRDGDLHTFFAHESYRRKKQKFCPIFHMTILSEALEIDAKVIDGAAIINMLKPTYGKTFRDYAINKFVPYISSLFRQVERVDLVWDR